MNETGRVTLSLVEVVSLLLAAQFALLPALHGVCYADAGRRRKRDRIL